MTGLIVEARRPTDPSADDGFEVSYVFDDGAERRVPLAQAWAVPLEWGLPVRRFRSRKGQRHLSGLWWSATTGGHVGFESWLERDQVLHLDFDPSVVGIASQLRLSPRHRTRPPCRGHRRRTRRTRRRRRSRSRPHPNGTRPGHRGARDPRCERPAHHQPSRDVGVDNLRQPRDRRRTSGRGRAPYARHPDYRRRRRRRKARNPTYLLGARRLDRAPEKCAVLEDAPAGVAAARAAGVTTIIGVAPSAHTFDVTICVADLR